jgi:hypothetical protein
MGNNQSGHQMAMAAMSQEQMACQDDLMCQNIDSKRSTVDNMVLVCPNAKCLGGTCSCGPGCERDPYTGICCSKVQKGPNGTTFCVEDVYKPPAGALGGPCKVPNQTINGVNVSGQQICDLYNRYQKQ